MTSFNNIVKTFTNMHVCEIKIHVMRSLKDMNQDYCRLLAFWANLIFQKIFLYHSL